MEQEMDDDEEEEEEKETNIKAPRKESGNIVGL
jgi:hypothetical protein